MRISEFRIKNYKSYYEEQSFQLNSGFNLIAGQNNVGKTALLEALQLDISGKTHRSVLSRPQETAPPNRYTLGGIKFVVSGDELKTLVLQSLDHKLTLLMPKENSLQQSPETILNHIFEQREITLSYSFQAKENEGFGWIFHPLPSHELYQKTGTDYFVYDISADRKSFTLSGRTGSPPSSELNIVAAGVLRGRIYRFLPERYGVSSCRFGRNRNLVPNGANLPEVLNVL